MMKNKKRVLELRYYGDPVLKKETEPVKEINRDIRYLIKGMIETMEFYEGAGLAAPQVGVSLSIFVVSSKVVEGEGGEALVFINPEILDLAGSSIQEEGCLSIPGLYAEVERPEYVKLKYLNKEGKENILEARGLLARVILHEYDHLKGILFVDRLEREERRILIARWRKNFVLNNKNLVKGLL
jgi:peptide deformylase